MAASPPPLLRSFHSRLHPNSFRLGPAKPYQTPSLFLTLLNESDSLGCKNRSPRKFLQRCLRRGPLPYSLWSEVATADPLSLGPLRLAWPCVLCLFSSLHKSPDFGQLEAGERAGIPINELHASNTPKTAVPHHHPIP